MIKLVRFSDEVLLKHKFSIKIDEIETESLTSDNTEDIDAILENFLVDGEIEKKEDNKESEG